MGRGGGGNLRLAREELLSWALPRVLNLGAITVGYYGGTLVMVITTILKAMSLPGTIVSQLSKCLKFMTFREGSFVIHVEYTST